MMPIYTGSHLIVYLIFSLIIGASIGSFLNVCILRIPRKISLSLPGSYCYQCGSHLGMSENIPIIGYFILKGKCKHCGSTFSFQYAWVEIVTALFSLLFFISSLNSISSFDPFAYILKLTFFSVLLVASLIDLKWEIIPDIITIPLAVLFIIAHYFTPNSFPKINQIQLNYWEKPNVIIAALLLYVIYFFFSHLEHQRNRINVINFILLVALTIGFILVTIFSKNNLNTVNPLTYALTGAIFTGGILYLITLPFKILKKQDFLGEGDIKLLFVLGAFIGGMYASKILIIWLYIAASFASILIFIQAYNKPIQKSEKLFGGLFLILMIIGLILVSYVQVIAFNKTFFTIGVSLFLSSCFFYFLLAKKWSDLKIVSKGFPMAPFIGIAALTYLFYLENIYTKFKMVGSLF